MILTTMGVSRVYNLSRPVVRGVNERKTGIDLSKHADIHIVGPAHSSNG